MRPMNSVQTRFNVILKNKVRFAACLKNVHTMGKRVHNEDEEIRMATAMFNKMKVSHPSEEAGKLFRFLKCLELPRDFSKFSTVMDGGSSSASQTKLSQKGKTEDKVKACKKDRPIRRRKAKEDLQTQHVRTKKVKLAEAVLRL